MTSNKWHEIQSIYHAARERKPVERAAFLAEACAGDLEILREVESLLVYEAAADQFIESPALEVAAQQLAEDQSKFFVGRTIGPYEVLSLLGTGGMGEVYLGRDTRLGRKIALKLLPAEFSKDSDRLHRFEREARTASALNHPNILTVYDIGLSEGLHFIATEYIEGETLRQRLSRARMKPEEIIEIAIQVAGALVAAHAAGIVHRDIKPENIMVRSDGLVKVLDFGVAKLTEHPAFSTNAPSAITGITTHTGSLIGTVRYMSPEQARGQEVDGRTDVFSLGLVLYEMVSGKRPFEGGTSSDVIAALLTANPPPLRKNHPAATVELERIISKCLAKDRERRYQSAAALRGDLTGLGGSSRWGRLTIGSALRSSVTAWRGSIQHGGTRALAGIVLAALVIGTAVYYWQSNLRPRERALQSTLAGPSAPSKPRRSVSVFGFKNLSGRGGTAWLAQAFSEMLTTELAAGEKVRTIPSESVARMKVELSLAEGDSLSGDTLARIRHVLGTDLLVLGSYLAMGEKSGGRIRLDLRLQDTAAGEIVASVSETGTETELLELVSRAGARLREKLGVEALSAAEASVVRASLPSSPVAARFYSEGLAKLRLFDALGARELLEKAITAEPDYPLAHAALADAWSRQGYDEKAKEEAKKAFDLSARLLQEERLSVEARYRETTANWEVAVEIYRRLWSFFPDTLDYGLRLARAQMAFGRAKDALVTIEALRKLPTPGAYDVRVDLAEAHAAGSLADYKKQQATANRAAEKAKVIGARLLLAEARLSEGRAHRLLGEAEKAKVAYEEAKEIYSAAGDQRGIVQSISSLAAVFHEQGNLVEAIKVYTEALGTERRIGNKRGIASMLMHLGVALWDQGDFSKAKAHQEEALAISREIGDKSGMATALSNIATLTYSVDLSRARKLLEQSAAIYREIGDKSGLARALNNIAVALEDLKDLEGAKRHYEQALEIYDQIGESIGAVTAKMNVGGILHYQGKLDEAKRLFEEAVATTRESGKKRWLAQALSCLAEVSLAEGNFLEARAKHEEALVIRKGLGERESIVKSQLDLARLSIEEGNPEKAELAVRQADRSYQALLAADLLAQSFLAQGRIAEARNAIHEAEALAGKTTDLDARFPVAITAARVSAASTRFAEARKILTSTLAETVRYGYAGYELEARLALGEVEIRSGQTAAGRARLEALEKEAKAKGHSLIARKAAAARSAASAQK